MSGAQSTLTAHRKAAASSPPKDSFKKFHADAADRQVPPPVHSPASYKENNGSASHSLSTSSTASPKLDKREASAGTSTLLPQNPSRLSSLRRRSKSKGHPSFVGSSDFKRGKTSKPSFFASLFHKLVSCVGINSRAHDVDVDGVASIASGHNGAKEFSGNVPERAIGEASVPTSPLLEKGHPVTPPKDVSPIPEAADPTSGAVQPPGSSVTVVSRSSSKNPSEDGTESNDDVGVQTEEICVDDVDMALIRNGGAGIPIGSVSGILI
jgi:RNA polymerase II subunit A small phosphatase-like protein